MAALSDPTNGRDDIAAVIAPPPLIALAALLLGLALDWLLPAYVIRLLLSFGERIFAGGLLLATGIALIVVAGHVFAARGTNIPPWKPALTLVTEGIYAYLRNPMYVGFGFVTAGLALMLASDWTLVLMIPAAVVLHRGVVLREEDYLARRFGEAYRRYRDRVPRYGIRW